MRGILIITCYNQEKQIEGVLDRAKSVALFESILVVDDCSTDGSKTIIEQSGLNFIRHEQNKGTGAAIRTGLDFGLRHAYDYMALLSGNAKTLPEELHLIVNPILNGTADYVTGNRFMKGGSSPGLPTFRRFAIPIFSIFGSLLIGRWFSDLTCGFRAYKLDFLKDPRVNIYQDWLNQYELEYYLHYWACKLNLRIAVVPVTIPYSQLQGVRKSHIRPFSGWWSMIRPLLFLRLGIKD